MKMNWENGMYRNLFVAAVSAAALVSAASGQLRIIGGLSNMDVYNETETECDEFEIELEGPHPEDVCHTYRNWNYGSPTIRSNASGTGIIVTYSNPQHPTARHSVEHFGVSLRSLSQITGQHFQWRSGPVTPPPLPQLPLLDGYTAMDEGEPVLVQTVTNVDPHGQKIWVQRKVTVAQREVALEELMPNDPLVEGSQDMDLVPVLLAPGQMLTSSESIADILEGSKVMSYEVYINNRTWTGWGWRDSIGNMLGTVMNASVIEQTWCSNAAPVITQEPENVSAEWDGRATFTVAAESNPNFGDTVYQWRHEGVDIEGEDQPVLNVDPVTVESAGAYTCVIRNDCSRTDSLAAYLTVTGGPGGGGGGGDCFADYNQDGGVDGSDIQKFFEDWEQGDNGADTNQDGGVDGADVELFFVQWENGGC